MDSLKPYIIAEAAQGYEGRVELARLLVKAAAKAAADAVKFQVVFADDLATPDYRYYDLFRQLEMSTEDWRAVREDAGRLGIGFCADIFGPRSLALARELGPDSLKLHSTGFFDDSLTEGALALGKPTYLSVGGIAAKEIERFAAKHRLHDRTDIVILFGYQAEPTPTERNNLARIAELRRLTGLEIGFMDHSDGAGPDTVNLSAMALGMGVRVFEKHITLDRALELEDYVSALAPGAFADYVAALRRLAGAMGSAGLALTDEEVGYRGRALKRVIAARDLPAGAVLAAADILMLRNGAGAGLFDPAEAVGRRLRVACGRGQPIAGEMLS